MKIFIDYQWLPSSVVIVIENDFPSMRLNTGLKKIHLSITNAKCLPVAVNFAVARCTQIHTHTHTHSHRMRVYVCVLWATRVAPSCHLHSRQPNVSCVYITVRFGTQTLSIVRCHWMFRNILAKESSPINWFRGRCVCNFVQCKLNQINI